MAPPATTERERTARAPGRGVRRLPRATACAASCARRSTWARARSSSSAATPSVAAERFGVDGERAGVVYTRTGRPFFADEADRGRACSARVRAAVDAPGCGTSSRPTGSLLDCELLPWSAKAEELLRAPVRVGRRGGDAPRWPPRPTASSQPPRASRRRRRRPARPRDASAPRRASAFVDAYRRYCWPVDVARRPALAPFQVLATEGRVRALEPPPLAPRRARPARRRRADRCSSATRTLDVDLDDPDGRGGRDRVVGGPDRRRRRGHGGQAASTSSLAATRGSPSRGSSAAGREYLRIIYGPEYTAPDEPGAAASARPRPQALARAARVRARASRRSSGSSRGEPLYRVHECVFGVLALESEPVDPRL